MHIYHLGLVATRFFAPFPLKQTSGNSGRPTFLGDGKKAAGGGRTFSIIAIALLLLLLRCLDWATDEKSQCKGRVSAAPSSSPHCSRRCTARRRCNNFLRAFLAFCQRLHFLRLSTITTTTSSIVRAGRYDESGVGGLLFSPK